ncbi:MAG: UvrB/UvrC motif-containing protein, partial [Thermoplasmata archaeon]
MSYIDLVPALRDWPHDPEKISVRKILGIDGQVRIQMRVELGIAQMEAEGRPDGTRPNGCVTVLDHHRGRLARFQELNGTSLGFALSPEECHE